MAVLIYLNHIQMSSSLESALSELDFEEVYLAASTPTSEIIDKVPNDEINFPIIPPHIQKENKTRAKLVEELSLLANRINETRPDLNIIVTLVGKDLDLLAETIANNDLKIKKIIKID
ncbi:hypothetical protein [Xylocopilactobacillus apicola]|uniref:Uncharacterized protein n=1 Tax=Xylocopilactobacillus apicola TaxID=2932184 RepID=A0AAU9D2D9_9LACO|nr:hypothetical protein [Xylocopilactobacillus apicola]BDR57894.1 hypothetical protein XA3_03350 [Xylocopilactobacillus apicola]